MCCVSAVPVVELSVEPTVVTEGGTVAVNVSLVGQHLPGTVELGVSTAPISPRGK